MSQTHKRTTSLLISTTGVSYNPGATAYPAVAAGPNHGDIAILNYDTKAIIAAGSSPTYATAKRIQIIMKDTISYPGNPIFRHSFVIDGRNISNAKIRNYSAETAQVSTVTFVGNIAYGVEVQLWINIKSEQTERLKIKRYQFVAPLGGATANDVKNAFISLINLDPDNAYTATNGGGGIVTITGNTRAGGYENLVVFEAGVDGHPNYSVATTTSPSPGVGNYFQVQDEENVYQSYTGYLNRVWMPVERMVPKTLVNTALTYDNIVIEHSNTMNLPFADTGAFTEKTSIYVLAGGGVTFKADLTSWIDSCPVDVLINTIP